MKKGRKKIKKKPRRSGKGRQNAQTRGIRSHKSRMMAYH